jgi:hypothetical protein
VHLQLMVFGDELVTAFKHKDYVIKVAAVFTFYFESLSCGLSAAMKKLE